MEFIFTNLLSVINDYRMQGNWLPQFRQRAYDYRKGLNMEEHQKNLKERLFGNGSRIVVNDNDYPFFTDRPYLQKLIWIHPNEKILTLNQVETMAKNMYPDKDYIIWMNPKNLRTIPEIPHYHLLLSDPEPEYRLKKLRVFIRHGNRGPILRLGTIEGGNNTFTTDAPLLPSGIETCHRVMTDMKLLYGIDPCETSIQSSPVDRCIDSAKAYADALSYMGDIFLNDNLKPNDLDFRPDLSSHMDIINIEEDYKKDLSNLKAKFNYYPEQLYDIYNLHSSLHCYQEMGLADIDLDISKKVDEIAEKAYNVQCKTCGIAKMETCLDLVKTLDTGHKYQIYSTHDTYILIMAHALAHFNELKLDLEIPIYCSNIRLETWESDQGEYNRIYFNNLFIGWYSELRKNELEFT
jgi:hypothetical protein